MSEELKRATADAVLKIEKRFEELEARVIAAELFIATILANAPDRQRLLSAASQTHEQMDWPANAKERLRQLVGRHLREFPGRFPQDH